MMLHHHHDRGSTRLTESNTTLTRDVGIELREAPPPSIRASRDEEEVLLVKADKESHVEELRQALCVAATRAKSIELRRADSICEGHRRALAHRDAEAMALRHINCLLAHAARRGGGEKMPLLLPAAVHKYGAVLVGVAREARIGPEPLDPLVHDEARLMNFIAHFLDVAAEKYDRRSPAEL